MSVDQNSAVLLPSLDRMKKYQKAKQKAEAQKEKDPAAQKERDLAAQKQREMLARQDKERRDRELEAALRDKDKPKEPDQTKAANNGTASHDNTELKGEPKGEPKGGPGSGSWGDPKNESSSGGKACQAACDDDKGGAPARKPTVTPNSESSRAALFRLGARTSIGKLLNIQITPTGTARLDFFTADAASRLQHLARGGQFIVNRKKVHGMTPQVSALPVPKGPTCFTGPSAHGSG
ncbi:hypothetical protein F5883DRAFT_672981 [Diaporthe sp. PMI_573]|nr:hypothetical protein F5883DRAFT_672981 [Diaporthaceae sp. PMI_573]